MKVSVLTSFSFKAHHDIFPLKVFRKQLKNIGITLDFHNNARGIRSSDCDAVFISSYQINNLFKKFEKPPQALLEFLQNLKIKGTKIIWFDSSDSADIFRPAVLQIVDKYAKAQLWKDLSIYKQSIHQGNLFKDFYKTNFGIEEVGGKMSNPLKDDEINKLALAWNLIFYDRNIHGKGKIRRSVNMLFPRSEYKLDINSKPLNSRSLDISFRSSKRNQTIVDFHRSQVREHIKALAKEHKYKTFYEGAVNYSNYKKELNSARVIPSPFGWGEICYRDFECFQAGGVLFKPDMSHLQTYPDIYKDNATYVSHSWDFSDFEKKLSEVLENIDSYQRIADKGQQYFMDALSPDKAGKLFAEHFAQLLTGN